MSSEELATRLLKFFSQEILEGDDEGLDENTPLLELGLLDSMSIAQLLTYAEEQLGIQVEAHEISPDEMETIAKMADFLERQKLAQQG